MESASDSREFVLFQTRKGRVVEIDQDPIVCREFGFVAGDRVNTPFGPGTVVGVSSRAESPNMWFFLDDDDGITFWVLEIRFSVADC